MGRGLTPALQLGPVLGLVLALLADPLMASGNVGCLFSPSLCDGPVEWCYDDQAFGKCLNMYERLRAEDLIRHELTGNELRAFERELRRLLLLGYRWSHTYTQCVLQAMLHSKSQYEPAACDNLSDQDLNLHPDEVDSKEMAFVRFTPNEDTITQQELVDDANDFADEVYFPPDEDIVPDSITPHSSMTPGDGEEEEPWQDLLKRVKEAKHKRSKDHVFSRVYNTPGEFREGRETKDLTLDDLEDIFNNEYFPNNGNGQLSREEILYLLNSQNPHHSYIERLGTDPINKWSETLDSDATGAALGELSNLGGGYATPGMVDPYYLSTTEYITKNRNGPERFSHQYNTPDNFRRGFGTRDTLLEDIGNGKGDMADARIYVDEDEQLPDDSGGSGSHRDYHSSGQPNVPDAHKDYPEAYDGVDDTRRQSDQALLSKLLDIWRGGGPPSLPVSAPVYTEGGMLYLPTPTGADNTEIDENAQLLDKSLGALLADYEWGFRRKERLDVKKPGPPFDAHNVHFNTSGSSESNPQMVKKGEQGSRRLSDTEGHLQDEDTTQHIHKSHDVYDVDSSYAYVGLKDSIRTWKEGARIVQTIGELLHLEPSAFSYPRVDRNEVTFRVEGNSKSWNASDVAIRIDGIKDELKNELGVEITSAGVGDKTKYPAMVNVEGLGSEWIDWENWSDTGTMWAALIAGTLAAAVAASGLFLLARHHQRRKSKIRDLTAGETEASQDYEELCRQRMAGKWQGGGLGGTEKEGAQRITSLSKDSDGNSPSTRSSTSSWSEEPALTNMDISTGHMVLTYMEDHLKNKDRLEQEWQALCAYEAEPCSTKSAEAPENLVKNRNPGVLPYDHSRIVLNDMSNIYNSDYINASTITDHDPRNPAYIAAQGPLPETTADWWQMVWEQGSVVVVMLTRLSEGSVLCHRYWPEEGSQQYHIYEVHLVSEHIWCDDYLVRSFYLKNLKTAETRTVTQFHFLSWPDRGVPSSTKAMLEFRRKVNKSYRGRSCPIVVHCSDGAGRTGTYCLIDMVLNRMAKGAKEIDIAATLEHIRDQRPHMVTTKQQFEFVLMAVAEEVHAILKALPAQLQQQHEKKEKEMEKEKQEKEK